MFEVRSIQQAKYALTISLVLSLAAPTAAKNWNTTNGNWNTAANWSPASVPTAGEAVNIVFTNGVARTVTYDVTAPSLGLVTIDLTGAGTTTNTLSMPNNFTLQSSAMFVGGYNGITSTATNGRGAVTQSNGSMQMSSGSDLALGYGAGSTGTYTLSGTGAFTAAQSEFIGFNGNGTFTQSGGTNTLQASAVGTLNLGKFAGAIGTYELSGGSLVSNVNEIVGDLGIGFFAHSGGTNTIQGAGHDLQLGANSGASGTYTLGGNAALSVANNIVVGGSGTGTLNIQGTSSVSATNAVNINASSAVNLSGGSLRLNSSNAPSRINFTSGKLQLGGNRTIGTDPFVTPLFGTSPVIPTNKELVVEGNLTVDKPLSVNGGKLTMLNISELNFTAPGPLPTLSVTNGGTVSVGSRAFVGNFATLTVSGVGSSFTCEDIFVADSNTSGTLTISGGAVVDSGLFAYVGGYPTGTIGTGTVTVKGLGSTWTDGNFFSTAEVGKNGVGIINIEDRAVVQRTIFHVYDEGVINLNGGSLHVSDITFAGNGKLNFFAGTIQFMGDRAVGFDSLMNSYFGASPTVLAGKNLGVDGTAYLFNPVVVNGGIFSAGAIANGYNLTLQRGTLNITNQALTVGSAGQLGSTLDLNDDMIVNVTLGTTNQGLVTGDGELGGSFTNSTTGELRGDPGKSLKLTGANNINAGQINLFGGMVEFTQNLTNNSGAFISGNGTLKVGTLLTNSGTMNFSGLANIVGDVTNNAGAKIISSGGGPTTFHDDVVNNGEIRTSAGSFTTFFGATSGSGTYTGTGTVNFEGDLKPGNSPAAISFAGNMALGVEAALKMELGGVAAGSQYDQVTVAGNLALDGALQITLINGFAPAAGNSFDLLNWSTLSGTFSSLNLPALAGGLTWNTSQLYTTGTLSVASAGTPGDYNNNGVVDAGDYILYRKFVGTTQVLPNDPSGGTIGSAQYATWRSNFGKPPGSGAGSSLGTSGTTVPEPNSIALLWMLTGSIYLSASRYGYRAFGKPIFSSRTLLP